MSIFSNILLLQQLFLKNTKKNSPKGELILGFGKHEISIKLENIPCTVTMNLKAGDVASCGNNGETSKIDVVINSHGFLLIADIKTNTCLVEWACNG